jgi:hypothetical protein
MSKLILRVRTKDNLLELLAQSQTGDWKVGRDKIQEITHIQVVNWDGTQMIEGVFDRNASYYVDESNIRFIVKFLDGKIVNCNVEFKSQNPVNYIHEYF